MSLVSAENGAGVNKNTNITYGFTYLSLNEESNKTSMLKLNKGRLFSWTNLISIDHKSYWFTVIALLQLIMISFDKKGRSHYLMGWSIEATCPQKERFSSLRATVDRFLEPALLWTCECVHCTCRRTCRPSATTALTTQTEVIMN